MTVAKVDPDLFRREVGQYKDRWYHDPLPSCELADEDLDFLVPSLTTLKKVAGKDWTNASLKRISEWLFEQDRDVWEMHGARDIAARLGEVSQAGLHKAFERGTALHLMMEVYGDGGDPETVELPPQAVPYRETVLRLLRREAPTVGFSEFVALSRTFGYGGTGDAVWFWRDEYWLVDYKSRTEKNTVYLEEAWQGGAYAKADYWVGARYVDGELVHERVTPLDLAGGLIVSIAPRDYRIRPFDLDKAFEGFLDLRQLWQRKADGVTSVFGPWLEPTPPSRDAWIRDRIGALKEAGALPTLRTAWPEDVPFPKKVEVYTDEQVDALVEAVTWAESQFEVPWPELDPGRPVEPPRSRETGEAAPVATETPPVDLDEGDLMPGALAAIERRFQALPKTRTEWIHKVAKQALEAGVPFRVAENPTARRVFLARALILGCERRLSLQTFTSILDSLQDPTDFDEDTVTLGERLGCLSWEQASVLAGLVSLAGPAEQDEPRLDIEDDPADPPRLPSADVLAKQSKDVLKEWCRERGLPVGGTKQDLIDRLVGEQTNNPTGEQQ